MAKTTSDAAPGGAAPIKYEYMFGADKSPTEQLDALLRAIAKHISKDIGNKQQLKLTPDKLAAFYKVLGGNYDSFLLSDHASISNAWSLTGCQHTLQPVPDNDYAPPTIPALTPRGFSRWESLEILLGPDEHVPYLQYAVKNWNLKHPETGQLFPSDLPKAMFPVQADEAVDRWHKSCADQLWKEAEEPTKAKNGSTQPQTERGREPKFSYVHVENPTRNDRDRDRPPPTERAERAERGQPYTYVHVHGSGGRSTGYSGRRRSSDKPSPEERQRRRSFSDFPSPTSPTSPPYPPASNYLDPNSQRPPNQPRRTSQTRHYSSTSSAEEMAGPHSNSSRRRHHSPSTPPRSGRHVPPTAPRPPSATKPGSYGSRPEELKRRSGNSPLGSLRNKVSNTVSSVLGTGRHERPRAEARESYQGSSSRSRRAPAATVHRQPQVYSETDSEDTTDTESSDEEVRRRHRRDADPYRNKARLYGEIDPRELSDDRDRVRRREYYSQSRPETFRRTSSHADIDRRREQAAAGWEYARERGRPPQVRDDRKRVW
ncbi:hypothetical protein N3K66_005761 [Trichothecium roseum]|uniref:Uncharacterized protein n=1 Tax=Trichothecium roseum TaxID=47278 RepID=A0ACC0V1G3_9HYPO|nr:hypothetical protein N3K66_005761 [Trichothecium roseum]